MLLPPLATPASWKASTFSGLSHVKPIVPLLWTERAARCGELLMGGVRYALRFAVALRGAGQPWDPGLGLDERAMRGELPAGTLSVTAGFPRRRWICRPSARTRSSSRRVRSPIGSWRPTRLGHLTWRQLSRWNLVKRSCDGAGNSVGDHLGSLSESRPAAIRGAVDVFHDETRSS